MDDEVVVPPLEHAGFRVGWSGDRGVFEVRSVVGDRRLSTVGRLWTAEHVIAELSARGFWLGSGEVFEALWTADELVSVAAGDPFVVGDPGSGSVGLASPDGRVVEPLVAPEGGFGWVGGSPATLAATARSVLRAAAPVACADGPGPGFRPALWAYVTRVATGRPELGLNVRVLQQWAAAAMDPTGSVPLDEMDALLDRVDVADGASVERALSRLRGERPERERGSSRRPRRPDRGLQR